MILFNPVPNNKLYDFNTIDCKINPKKRLKMKNTLYL